MRISDWSSDVCSSDLGHRSSRRASAGLPALRAAFLAGPRLADGRLVGTDLAAGIGIAIDTAFEVAQQQVVAVAPDDVVGQQGDLAAALGRVDHVLRHGIAGGVAAQALDDIDALLRSDEHTSELQSLMRTSYAVFCLNKQKNNTA